MTLLDSIGDIAQSIINNQLQYRLPKNQHFFKHFKTYKNKNLQFVFDEFLTVEQKA